MKLRAPFQKVLSEGIDVYQSQTDEKVIPLGKKIKAKGYSTKKEFQVISDWKSPRVRQHILSNPDNVIKKMKSNKASWRKNKLYGMTDDEIKETWKLAGQDASNEGSRLHEDIEKYYN